MTTDPAQQRPGEWAVRFVGHVMGMPISLALRGRCAGDERGRAAWDDVMASLRAADSVFSTYRADSVIRRLDRGEIALADCPPEVREVLDLGAAAERDSGGAFSVHRPDADGRVVLDPSGVVKGWATERAAGALRALADTDFCLSAGGDLVCRSRDPDAGAWRIGIEDPRDPTRLVAVVPIATGAVATSGTAHRGAHLVDARTGRAPDGVASVTVIASSLTVADIDATAAYAHGRGAADWLRTRPGRSGLVVWADGSTTVVQPPDPWPGAVSPPLTGTPPAATRSVPGSTPRLRPRPEGPAADEEPSCARS